MKNTTSSNSIVKAGEDHAFAAPLPPRTRLWLALAGWLLVLTILPWSAHRFTLWILVFSPLVGAYFVSWLGMLRHELWHGYIEGVDNRRFFRIVCFALCLEPETYRLSHGSHHAHANTARDLQMYPEDFLQNPQRARRQFVLELLFGNLAWELSTTAHFHRKGQLSRKTILCHLPARLTLPVTLALLFGRFDPGAAWAAVANFALVFWAGSIMTRHNQWLQHLAIFAEGTLEERNLLTRNLRNKTCLEKFVNFLNHDDSLAHTSHHTHPGSYSRLEEKNPAADHLQITLTEYVQILGKFSHEVFTCHSVLRQPDSTLQLHSTVQH